MAHGRIIYVEIPVADLQRAADFYAGLLGWSFESSSPDLWLFTPGFRGAMGAITTSRRPTIDGLRLHVQVDDLDATLAKAVVLGARIERGRSFGTVTLGDTAVVRDPDGNWLGIFQSRLGDVRQAGHGANENA